MYIKLFILPFLSWMFMGFVSAFMFLDRETVQYTKEKNPEMGNRIVNGIDTLSDISYIERNYVLVGDEVAGEKLFICANYSQMKIVDHLSSVILENPGDALVIDIGDLDDDDKYADGLVLSSGGTVLFTANPGVNNQDPIITSDRDSDGQGDAIFATIKTATNLTAGQKVRIKLAVAVNS